MGITLKTTGVLDEDRSIARITIFTEDDDRDKWRADVHSQDALYDAQGNRAFAAQFGTVKATGVFGEIKEQTLSQTYTVSKVSDLLEPIRELAYALIQAQMAKMAQQKNPPSP